MKLRVAWGRRPCYSHFSDPSAGHMEVFNEGWWNEGTWQNKIWSSFLPGALYHCGTVDFSKPFPNTELEITSSSFCPRVLAVPSQANLAARQIIQVAKHFGLVHFGSSCIDTPMCLTSSGAVLWDYQSVWFKTRQASPDGLHPLFSLWWKTKTHWPPKPPPPRKPGKSLIFLWIY